MLCQLTPHPRCRSNLSLKHGRLLLLTTGRQLHHNQIDAPLQLVGALCQLGFQFRHPPLQRGHRQPQRIDVFWGRGGCGSSLLPGRTSGARDFSKQILTTSTEFVIEERDMPGSGCVVVRILDGFGLDLAKAVDFDEQSWSRF